MGGAWILYSDLYPLIQAQGTCDTTRDLGCSGTKAALLFPRPGTQRQGWGQVTAALGGRDRTQRGRDRQRDAKTQQEHRKTHSKAESVRQRERLRQGRTEGDGDRELEGKACSQLTQFPGGEVRGGYRSGESRQG